MGALRFGMLRRGVVLLAASGALGSIGLTAMPATASTAAASQAAAGAASSQPPVPAPITPANPSVADRPDPVMRAPGGAPPPTTPPVPSGTWQALGPAPIGFSSATAFAGRVTAVVVIPSGTHAGRVVIGSAGGGIWTSDDSGVHWTSRTDSAGDLAIGSIAEDPSTPDHLIAGTGEENNSADSYYGDGILTSSDGGTTWSLQDPGGVFDGKHIGQVAIDQSHANHQFAATDGGLYVTSDGGTTWAKPSDASYGQFDGEVTSVVIDPSNSNNVYLATDVTPGTGPIVGKSTDGGVTWSVANTGLTGGTYRLISLAIAPSSPSTLYVSLGSQNGSTAVRLFKSTDGAAHWSQLAGAPSYTSFGYYYGSGSGDQGWYDNVISVKPTDANDLVVGGTGIAETTDGGTTWSSWGTEANGLPHPDQHAFAWAPGGDLWIGDDGGVYHRTPPATTSVTAANGNLNITQLYFGFNVVGTTLLAGSQDNSSVETTSTSLSPWTQIFGGDGGPSYTTPNLTSLQFIEADRDLYVTTDNFATTLTDITPPAVGEFTPPIAVIPNTTTPSAPTVLYGGPDVYRTTNPTVAHPTWTKVTSVGNASANPPLEVTAITTSPTNPQVVYVGFSNGVIQVSTDGGQTFTSVASAAPAQPWVTGISVDPTNAQAITASFSYNDTRYFSGLPHVEQFSYTTTPGSGTWTTITGSGLPNAVSRVVYDRGDLLAATDSGVYASNAPNGASTSWARVGTGMPNVQVQDLFVTSDYQVYAVTHGLGAWRLPAPTITHTPADFTGDAKTDISVFRPSTSRWYERDSASGAVSSAGFGTAGDIPVTGDYDGDGQADMAVFRPSAGRWWIQDSSNAQITSIGFGANGDIPVPGDYDGDGKTDLAVVRQGTPDVWYVRNSSTGQVTVTNFGTSGDVPVPGDYDGDGKTDLAVMRPGTPDVWYVKNSSNGQVTVTNFGTSGDVPSPGDYDGDGKTDLAVLRPSAGQFYVKDSSNGQVIGTGFGEVGDVPVPGDYDGDGKTDMAIFRPSTGHFWIKNSSDGTVFAPGFGTNGDTPTATPPAVWMSFFGG